MLAREVHHHGRSAEDGASLSSWLTDGDPPSTQDAPGASASGHATSGSALHPTALVDLVKADLRRKWRSGRPVSLESYLAALPELGTRDTLPADLILVEYLERRRSGVPVELAEYASRFPAQADRLRQLAERPSDTRPGSRPRARVVPADRPRHLPASMSRPAATPIRLSRVFGRYRILRRLGEGSMGRVYLAHDTQLDRRVALKVPHRVPGGDTGDPGGEDWARFSREVRAAATLNHPGICPVYDQGQIGGIYYLTMAYVKGRPLSDFIGRGGPKPQRWSAAAVRKLALALEQAHDQGVIHRDLKPANIMVTARRELVIMDFGLAWRVGDADARLTKAGTILGTPAYTSPEQLSGDRDAIGPRCDIYSLGVILYELLAGRRPFEGPTMAILAQVLHISPKPPSEFRPDLDTRLEAICLKAMSKRSEDRYATMGELAAAFGTYLRESRIPGEPEPRSDDPIATDSSTPTADRPPAHDAERLVDGESRFEEGRAEGSSVDSFDRPADLAEQLVANGPVSELSANLEAVCDPTVMRACDPGKEPGLEWSMRAWTSVVERFVLRRTRHPIDPEVYEALYRGLIRACRAWAAACEESERGLCERIEDLAQPWLTLSSLEHLDRALRLDLLIRCRLAELELHGRPQDARALREQLLTSREPADRPPSLAARCAAVVGIGSFLMVVIAFLIVIIYQFYWIRFPSGAWTFTGSPWSGRQ